MRKHHDRTTDRVATAGEVKQRLAFSTLATQTGVLPRERSLSSSTESEPVKRRTFEITSSRGHRAVRYAFNSGIRAIEQIMRETAAMERREYVLVEASSVKDTSGFHHVSGRRVWASGEARIVFDIVLKDAATEGDRVVHGSTRQDLAGEAGGRVHTGPAMARPATTRATSQSIFTAAGGQPLHPFCNVCGWRKGGVDSWNGRACRCGHSEPAMKHHALCDGNGCDACAGSGLEPNFRFVEGVP